MFLHQSSLGPPSHTLHIGTGENRFGRQLNHSDSGQGTSSLGTSPSERSNSPHTTFSSNSSFQTEQQPSPPFFFTNTPSIDLLKDYLKQLTPNVKPDCDSDENINTNLESIAPTLKTSCMGSKIVTTEGYKKLLSICKDASHQKNNARTKSIDYVRMLRLEPAQFEKLMKQTKTKMHKIAALSNTSLMNVILNFTVTSPTPDSSNAKELKKLLDNFYSLSTTEIVKLKTLTPDQLEKFLELNNSEQKSALELSTPISSEDSTVDECNDLGFGFDPEPTETSELAKLLNLKYEDQKKALKLPNSDLIKLLELSQAEDNQEQQSALKLSTTDLKKFLLLDTEQQKSAIKLITIKEDLTSLETLLKLKQDYQKRVLLLKSSQSVPETDNEVDNIHSFLKIDQHKALLDLSLDLDTSNKSSQHRALKTEELLYFVNIANNKSHTAKPSASSKSPIEIFISSLSRSQKTKAIKFQNAQVQNTGANAVDDNKSNLHKLLLAQNKGKSLSKTLIDKFSRNKDSLAALSTLLSKNLDSENLKKIAQNIKYSESLQNAINHLKAANLNKWTNLSNKSRDLIQKCFENAPQKDDVYSTLTTSLTIESDTKENQNNLKTIKKYLNYQLNKDKSTCCWGKKRAEVTLTGIDETKKSNLEALWKFTPETNWETPTNRIAQSLLPPGQKSKICGEHQGEIRVKDVPFFDLKEIFDEDGNYKYESENKDLFYFRIFHFKKLKDLELEPLKALYNYRGDEGQSSIQKIQNKLIEKLTNDELGQLDENKIAFLAPKISLESMSGSDRFADESTSWFENAMKDYSPTTQYSDNPSYGISPHDLSARILNWGANVAL